MHTASRDICYKHKRIVRKLMDRKIARFHSFMPQLTYMAIFWPSSWLVKSACVKEIAAIQIFVADCQEGSGRQAVGPAKYILRGEHEV